MAAMVSMYVEVRGQFSQILAVTPAYRYAPELPNLYNFAHDGSLERSLASGGGIFAKRSNLFLLPFAMEEC